MKRRVKTRSQKPSLAKKQTGATYKRLSQALIGIGSICLLLWITHKILYIRSLRISDTVLSSFSYTGSYKTYISHIRVGERINIPVVESGYLNGDWIVSPDKANHVFQSALPGTPGNIIIYAHNKTSLFGPLREVKKNETIQLATSDGARYSYTVTGIIEVDPSETSLLKPTLQEILTLYTCSGWLDSKRFVVRAVPRVETP